jgi:hypothetical protein
MHTMISAEGNIIIVLCRFCNELLHKEFLNKGILAASK